MSYSIVCLTIFIFRGQPDAYHNRHVLVYFTSPDDPTLHETVHTQRDDEKKPWRVDRINEGIDWMMSTKYIAHVNAGAVKVPRGQERLPVDIAASISVEGREQDSGWNCQNLALEGLQAIVSNGLQTGEWYDSVEGELMDKLLDGAVG